MPDTNMLKGKLLRGAALVAAMLLLSASAALAADMIKVQGESMTLTTGISVVNDSSAEPIGTGNAIRYTASATARQNVTYTKGATQIVVRARKEGTNANHPLLKVFTKTGTQSAVLRGSATVSSTSYQEYTFPFSANSGTHQVQVRGGNIASGRLLVVDYFRIPEAASTVATDTDGDGVLDANDLCSTQPGPASNNGCPIVEPPPTGGFPGISCEVTISPGQDAAAKLNGAAAGNDVCVVAGSYTLSAEVNLQQGVKVHGEQAKYLEIGGAGKGIDPEPVSKLVVAHGGDNGINMRPGVQIRWLDLSGVNPSTAAGGGRGSFLAGATCVDTCLVEYNEIHGNASAGITGAAGEVMRNEFYDNTNDPTYLGFNAGSVKGDQEYEAAFNFIHDEQGNGLWCDNGCSNVPSQGITGAWFHDNVIVNVGRAGIRFEEAPDIGDTNDPDAITHLAEGNIIGGSAKTATRGDIHAHDVADVVIRNNSLGAQTVAGVGSVPAPGSGNGIMFTDSCRTDRPDLGDPDFGEVYAQNNNLHGSNIVYPLPRASVVNLLGNTNVGQIKVTGSGSCG